MHPVLALHCVSSIAPASARFDFLAAVRTLEGARSAADCQLSGTVSDVENRRGNG